MPAQLRDYTPWTYAWDERGQPSLLGLAAVHPRLSVTEEAATHAQLSVRVRLGPPAMVRIEHHRGGTRAWTATRPTFLGALGEILPVAFGMWATVSRHPGGGRRGPLALLQAEVHRRAQAARTGAGTP